MAVRGTKAAAGVSGTMRAAVRKTVPLFIDQALGAETMPRQQSPAQRETVERVMHEFKHGELRTARGARKVKNPKQAVAIALHEAGASKFESPKENRRNLARTKAKERRGDTYKGEAERRKGRAPAKSNGRKSSRAKSSRAKSASDKTKAELYAEARRRDIAGRSKMNKRQLEHALGG
jgi:hypothetical protein